METTIRTQQNTHPEFLSAGGQMSRRIREFDWSKNPLGSLDNWPQSLRTIISICLNSNFPIAIYWGKELTLLYNDSWSPIPGNKHPWALGRPAKEVWPDIWEAIEPQFKKAFAGEPGGSKDALLPMQRHGYTEECYFDFTFTPVYGEGSKVEGVFNAVIETTYRVINERRTAFLKNLAITIAASQTSADVYRHAMAFMETATEDISFSLLFTRSGNDIALSLSSLTIPANLDQKQPWPFEDILQTGHTFYIENLRNYFHIVPNGFWPEEPKEGIIVPLKNSTGSITGFLICGLSSRRRFDSDYKIFIEAIVNAITTVLNNISSLEEERKKAEALAEIDRAKTAFFSNISHEFRTPLTLMLSPLEEVLSNAKHLLPNEKENLQVSYRNTLRLQKLVNTLLDFSRIEAGRMQPHFEAVDICELTTDLASSFRSAIEKEGLQLKVDCEPLSQPVPVDIDMWEKIVLNLISNAFKYTLRGKIGVTIKQAGRWIKLSVSDTGIGIPEDQLTKVFERFHRANNTGGRSQEGTGIGLSLVQELVAVHGGSIDVKSGVGKGSVFTVSIPAVREEIQVSTASQSLNKTAGAVKNVFAEEAGKWLTTESEINTQKQPSATPKNNRVLVADDNSDMRSYIRRLLSDDFDVLTATNGEDAFNMALQQIPDLIISDVMMPKLDGFGLLKQLRNNDVTRNVPVIFLSARAGEESKVEGLEAGADDYLVKPFSSRELVARVEGQIKLRKRRDKALKDLYNLFQEVPFAVAVLMGDSLVIEFINQYNLNIWQRTREQVWGKPLFEVFPGNKAAAQPIYEEVFRTGRRFSATELPIEVMVDGKLQTKWFNTTIDPLRNEQGQIIGQLATTIEITDQVIARKKTEESEHYFRSLSDTVPAIIWITEPDGRCSYLNKLWYDYTGQNKHEAEGFGWLNAIHPDDKEQAGKTFLEANAQQKSFHCLYRLLNKTGEFRWIRDMGSPKFSSDGVFEGMIGTVIDVHEEKIAEEALRKLSADLELATSAAEVGTWSLDVPSGHLQWSGLHKKLWGYDEHRTDLLYEDWHSVILPEDKKAALEKVENAMHLHIPYEAIYRIKRANDGVIRWMRSLGQYFYNDAGEAITLTGVSIDITAQKETEQAITQSEERFRTLAETLPQLVWMTDEKGDQEYASSRWKSYTGVEPTGAGSWEQIVHPDDITFIKSAWTESMLSGNLYKTEVRLRNKEGEYRWHFVQGEPIQNEKGEVIKWIGAFTDIHDQKTVSQQLEKLVAQRTAELQRSNEDLQQFAHVASHDLKEPIRKVRTFGSRLEEEYGHLLPEKGKLYLQKMQSSAERMFGLIDGVLNYSTINSLETSNDIVDLDSIVRAIETDLEILLSQKEAQINRQPLPAVHGSSVLLNQLFYNLINNALKFSNPATPPVISIDSKKLLGQDIRELKVAEAEKEFIQISICDNGIGFDQEHAEKIFKTFTRLNSRDKYEGTGLGLALCKKIVERHNGYIYAKAKEGEGACFYVVLPV